MEKIEKIETLKTILEVHQRSPVYWKDVKDALIKNEIELQDNDFLEIGYDEGYLESDSGLDAHFYIIIERMQLETDEEFNERMRQVNLAEERQELAEKALYEKLKQKYGE